MSKKYNKIIEAILKDEPLFIKNTGVVVRVEYFNTKYYQSLFEEKKKRSETNSYSIKIEFQSIPTVKAVNLCDKFCMRRNSITRKLEIEAEIDIKNLSLTPFVTSAAKILYEQNKTKKGK